MRRSCLVVISLVMLFFKQIFLKETKRLSATILEMSQIYNDKGKDNTETTEMHDNPLYDPDEEHGQVKKEEEEDASENVAADEWYVESIGDADDVGTEVGHLYRDSATDIVPVQINPMLHPEDVVNH